jgi:hypothetical protein
MTDARRLLPAKENTTWLSYVADSTDGQGGRAIPGRFSANSLASMSAGIQPANLFAPQLYVWSSLHEELLDDELMLCKIQLLKSAPALPWPCA